MPTIFRQKVVSNSVTFNDTLPDGAHYFAVDICDGWKDTGDPEESSVELGSYRDGVSAASFFPVRSKFITVGGYAVSATESGAEGLADTLVRDAFPRNRSFVFQRYEAVPKFMNLRRSGAVEFEWSSVRRGFRWSTVLMGEDPFRYALTLQTVSTGIAGTGVTGHTFPVTFPMSFTGTTSGNNSAAIITNSGTAYSSNFTATLVGNLAKGAWRRSNDTTGQAIGFNVALSTTDQLVIDFQNQIASLNGFPVSTDYLGNFWQLAPGVNSIRLYAEYDANASATISGYSAWE